MFVLAPQASRSFPKLQRKKTTISEINLNVEKNVSVNRLSARTTLAVRHGFSLVELLVVVSIISLLMAIILPAVNAARESARQTVCVNNLHQFGIGMHAYANRHNNRLCSGAFDWLRDGPVTEVGWVADLVNDGTPVGEMLCPSNLARGSATLNDLLTASAGGLGDCVDLLGEPLETAPDGSTFGNPCRQIVDNGLTGEARRSLVETAVVGKAYNTNYTAGWFLVRSGAVIDADGNLKSDDDCTPKPALDQKLRSRLYTLGPMSESYSDGAASPISNIPIMGDGQFVSVLSEKLGSIDAGEPLVASMTAGPVRNPSMEHEVLSGPREGATGWWSIWTNSTLQDYRLFSPLHRGAANILFADGSVRSFVDENDDGVLNNGFTPTATNGFQGNEIELPRNSVNSNSSLREF
jgi:prepilin-type N-terminal cleavage/methylation domain-containing protein/prepilin-type processing-associated H-X9-DG protein